MELRNLRLINGEASVAKAQRTGEVLRSMDIRIRELPPSIGNLWRIRGYEDNWKGNNTVAERIKSIFFIAIQLWTNYLGQKQRANPSLVDACPFELKPNVIETRLEAINYRSRLCLKGKLRPSPQRSFFYTAWTYQMKIAASESVTSYNISPDADRFLSFVQLWWVDDGGPI